MMSQETKYIAYVIANRVTIWATVIIGCLLMKDFLFGAIAVVIAMTIQENEIDPEDWVDRFSSKEDEVEDGDPPAC